MLGIICWFDMEMKCLGVDWCFGVVVDEKMIMVEKLDIVVFVMGGLSFMW